MFNKISLKKKKQFQRNVPKTFQTANMNILLHNFSFKCAFQPKTTQSIPTIFQLLNFRFTHFVAHFSFKFKFQFNEILFYRFCFADISVNHHFFYVLLHVFFFTLFILCPFAYSIFKSFTVFGLTSYFSSSIFQQSNFGFE